MGEACFMVRFCSNTLNLLVYRNNMSPMVSGFSFLSIQHIYRWCYFVSLCVSLGQMLSGYGVSKGLFVLGLSILDSSWFVTLFITFAVGVWYPLMWCVWLYIPYRVGGVVDLPNLVFGKGLILSKITLLLWSCLLISQL